MQDMLKSIVFAAGVDNAKSDKFVHGGKGAGLIDMCNLGLNVPPGIIIPVAACKVYEKLANNSDKATLMSAVMADLLPNLQWLKAKLGYMPLLSVRSGAPVSMPGMMDTILNVGAIGVTDVDTFWRKRLGSRAFYDCQRRLIEMLGTTAYNIPSEVFADIRAKLCALSGAVSERDLDAEHLIQLVEAYLDEWEKLTGDIFPDFQHQLSAAIEAVFKSWNSERAIEYRKLNKIPSSYGTAVTIQAMVFGNLNDLSGTGVLFSRNPSTGEGGMFGEYLVNAQGEDVVAGTATPVNINEMGLGTNDAAWQDTFFELEQTCFKLEAHYDDMVDVEFTVQDGELFILQSRVGKRSALAAFVVAHDMVEGGLIGKLTAFKRLTREQVITIRLPSIDPSFKKPATFKGLPACPGVIKGVAVHTSSQAVEHAEKGIACILVREETSPDDIAGMAKAAGILTRTGGATSHAAVVARAMDKPCVVGATSLVVSDVQGIVTIDGSTGNVWVGVDVPVVAATDSEIVQTVMGWALDEQGAQALSNYVVDAPCVLALSDHVSSVEDLKGFFSRLASVDCSQVTLDCRHASWLVPLEDSEFNNCFGVSANVMSDVNEGALVNALWEHRSLLKGLTLAGFPNLTLYAEKLAKYGFKVCEPVKALPPEYALFKAIANAKE